MNGPEPFSRAEAIEALRPRLWNFLRSHARVHELGRYVEALWDLEPGQFEELITTHLALSEETERALVAMDDVLPRLPSSIARSEQEYVGYVHGPVDWVRTRQRRVATADPTLFVCRPVERRYDTPVARLCHAALHVCAGLAPLTGLAETGEVGRLVHERSERARRLLRHPKLVGLRRPRPPAPGSTRRVVERWPQLEPAAGLLTRFDEALRQRREAVVEQVVCEQLLAPSADDDLFELQVAFTLIDALRARGFEEHQEQRLLGDVREALPLARLESVEHGRVDVWWDRALWTTVPAADAGTSRLRAVLEAAGMTQQPFRPDVLLHFHERDRIVLVEAKVTGKEGAAAERRGILEAFAYLLDAEQQFVDQPFPHALVVAWNATGSPAPSRVAVCDQHSIAQPLEWILQV